MKYLNPDMSGDFLDFIDRSFLLKSDGSKASLAPIIIALNKISNFYDIKAREAMGEDIRNLKSSIVIHPTGVVQQFIENKSFGDIFDKKILAIYVPLEGSTFLISVTIKDRLEVLIDYYPEYLLVHCGLPTFGIYQIFYRLTGRKDAAPLLLYIENRFNIYNKAMRKLEYDDIALDTRVVYSFLSSTFESMMVELAENNNLIYIKDSINYV